MDENQYYTIILRHDTSTLWMTNDPVLRLGELGMEDDTHKVKRGDGESKWSELPYEDFGLVYIVTFENLHGDLEENETLVEEFNKKISKKTFEDVNNKVVARLVLTSEEEGEICRITRITKDVETAGTVQNVLQIYSSDNSVQGYWNIDSVGVKKLDLVARSAIKDYEPSHTYFKDQICYYHNKLYRAYQDLVAGPTFNENQWVLLSSLHSGDIKYDNLISGLDAENVKDAIDELKRRDDRKVQKSTEERIVYGTDTHGNQTVIPIDDLRKVDTVNHKQADLSKNVQIDASDINYSDADPSLGTIRRVLDAKVDKTFAGHGAKIVRDVRFTYNETTGHISLEEDKVSPEDGTSGVESVEIDVVSEQELATTVTNINTRITNEVSTLNGRIDTEVETLNGRITTEVGTLNNRIDTEVETLNNTIDTKETEIYTKIQEEHDEINARVDEEVNLLDTRITDEVTTLNDRIDEEVQTLNTTINTKEQALQEQIDTNADEIARVEADSIARDEQLDTDINARIDNEVLTIDTRITGEVQTLNNRITNEVTTLNTRITSEVDSINATMNAKETAMDNKKIDKDISETIVTFLEVATHDRQPTIKITNKNTTTKTANYDYLHFGTLGNITTRMEDADHIIIDSTAIDLIDTQQNERLTNAENRLTAHDGQIATLLQHDINHDRHLEAIDAQIVNHETRLDTDEANITQLQQDLETEATTRENSDNALSQRITTNAVAITTKADKIFAQDTNNHVVGKLESDAISGNVILNLKETMVSPQDNSSSVERIRIISSDGTVIATRDSETGVIDIKTNLDTDVNYFVTPEIISVTIADETELDMTQLTPTDKTVVEINDIITDPEGTWGRVKSIDIEEQTCVVVTFKKHAQAVWGTIKGTLADQTDLQGRLSTLKDNIDDEATTRESADTELQNSIDTLIEGVTQEAEERMAADNTLQDNIDNVENNLAQETQDRQDADNTLQGNIDAVLDGLTQEVQDRQDADDEKVDKTSNANQVYGTNENGEQTTYNKEDFGKVDTVNGVQADANKNVELFATDISTTDQCSAGEDTIEQIINNMWGYMSELMTDLQTQIQTYTTNTEYEVAGSYVSQKFVTFTRADGVMLMAKVLRTFTSDTTQATAYESFMKDVELNNLQLVGIPEQVGPTPVPPTPTDEYEEAFDILNDVDGQQDEYTEPGGTDEEIEEILDEILGNE